MDLLALKNEINNDPTGKGYGVHLPASPGLVANLLNDSTESMTKERFATARTILAECADGAAILDALESAAATNAAVKWAMKFLTQDGGLDVGHPVTQGMLDQLVTAGVLTAAQGAALKSLAKQPASRAEVLFGVDTRVEIEDIRNALAIV